MNAEIKEFVLTLKLVVNFFAGLKNEDYVIRMGFFN
jgi:hypothetical protein